MLHRKFTGDVQTVLLLGNSRWQAAIRSQELEAAFHCLLAMPPLLWAPRCMCVLLVSWEL